MKSDPLRVVIFSKDRPMQLQALLESLLHHAKPTPPITIVLRPRSEYNRLRSLYTDILWLEEREFDNALRAALSYGDEELVMFVVDDQIITGPMDLGETEWVMKDKRVHAYSFRLGENIANMPDDWLAHGLHSKAYTWRGKPKDWGYPFSMDTQVYRRDDLMKVFTAYQQFLTGPFRAPADYEAFGLNFFRSADSPDRPLMACPRGNSVAYCQDLNKVQQFHGAPQFGTAGVHDVESLITAYNAGFRIDWESAEGHVHDDPFVRQRIWRTFLT